jgi:hypothetical protein
MFRPGTVSSSVIFASMKPCLIWTKSEKMPCASFDTAKRSRKLENCGELKMQAAVGPAGKSTPLTWFASGLISFRSVFTCKRVPLDFSPFWAGLDVSPRISKIHFKWKKEKKGTYGWPRPRLTYLQDLWARTSKMLKLTPIDAHRIHELPSLCEVPGSFMQPSFHHSTTNPQHHLSG